MTTQRSNTLAVIKILVALILASAGAVAWHQYARLHFPDQSSSDVFGVRSGYPMCLGLSALFTSLVFDRNFSAIAFRIPHARYFGMAIPLAIALTLVPFILNVILYLTGITDTVPPYPRLLIVGFPVLIVMAAGQEMMWRGLLFNNFAKFFGFTSTSIIIGLLWALWQLPILLNTSLLNFSHFQRFSIPMFILLMIGSSFIYTYLRMVSRSIWPCVFLHALCNLLLYALIDTIERPAYPWSPFFMHDAGFLYVFAALSGALYYSSRIKKIYL
jgi:membrane protease YdiL (CAAX protease family)